MRMSADTSSRGSADGVRVLVIGVIHGDEDAGFAVVEELRKIELDAKIDLWLVPTMNPDGQVGLKIRQNANGVGNLGDDGDR